MNQRSAGSTPVHSVIAIAVAMAVALLGNPAAAALYKWTDASGRVVYSDQPPPGGIKSEILGPVPAPANPNAVKDLATKDAELRQRQTQRAEQDKKSEKARSDTARKEEMCAQIRSQLKTYQSDIALFRVNEKGERVFVDDAARQKERDRLQTLQREQCPG